MATNKKTGNKPTKRAEAAPAADKAEALALHETVTVGDETLEGTAERASTLLKGIATIRSVRALLRRRGYNAEIHKRGWNLVAAANGFTGDEDEWFEEDKGVADAIAAIDAADESTFRIAAAALKHSFPKQHTYLFENLKPSRGAGAVSGMKLFLDRLDKLAAGKATKDPAKDRAAIVRLAERGIGDEQRAQLAGWVEAATSLASDEGSDELEAAEKKREAERRRALLELRAWFEEWAEITRELVTRGDHQIRLGLAELKRSERETPPDEGKK
jgi:hypothetical protein